MPATPWVCEGRYSRNRSRCEGRDCSTSGRVVGAELCSWHAEAYCAAACQCDIAVQIEQEGAASAALPTYLIY